MWRNQIEQIDVDGFKGLDNLEKLYLRSNKLTKIESNTFQHLTKLKKLNLSENQIEQIDVDGFKGLDNLEKLNLSDNKLSVVESKSFQHFKNIKNIKFW